MHNKKQWQASKGNQSVKPEGNKRWQTAKLTNNKGNEVLRRIDGKANAMHKGSMTTTIKRKKYFYLTLETIRRCRYG